MKKMNMQELESRAEMMGTAGPFKAAIGLTLLGCAFFACFWFSV